MPPLCSGLARRPLKAVAPVRIRSGVPPQSLPNPRYLVARVCRDGHTDGVYAYKYDAAGNLTTRAAFVHTWNSEGRLASTKNGSAAAASYIYDADGGRLLRRNPDTTTTLYVGDTEITLGTSTTTPKTAQRWYQFGGKTIATRTSVGMTLLAADHHGTGEAQLDAYSASYVTRKFTPFGGTRGGGTSSGTASATWRGDHGFLDKPVDATSGLTQVGARYYDNGIGSFISVDPLLDTNDPHQANAYNYARNNPLTYSDPTGLMCADGCGAGGSSSRSYDSLAGVSEGSPRGLGTETPNVSSPGSTTPVVQAKPSGLKKILFTVAGATVDFKIAFTQRLMRWSDTSLKRLMFANRTRSILIRSRNGTIGKVPPSTAARADLRLLNASKWASRGLGVIGAGVSFGLAKADGDGNTEAALKTGISLGLSSLGATVAGAGCGLVTAGIAAAACAAGGAAVGGYFASLANEKFDSQIETAAEFVNDTASTISDGASRGWEASKSFASTVGGTVGGWFD